MLAVYAHVLDEGQRRAHVHRLAAEEREAENGGGHLGVTWSDSESPEAPDKSSDQRA